MCRLDYCNSAGWHRQRPSSAPPFSLEHCSSFGVRGSTPRPHRSGSCKPPLATSSQDGDIQEGNTDVEVSALWTPELFGGPLCSDGFWQVVSSCTLLHLAIWQPHKWTSPVQRTFAVFRLSTWNKLPAPLWLMNTTLQTFHCKLKTYLFQQ